MGFFNNWPFSNLHNLNLDWIVEQIKKLTDMSNKIWERVKPVDEDETSTITAAQAYERSSEALYEAKFASNSVDEHITNLNNPHGVTVAQIGAEPTITILNISKGGTGASNPTSARANLNARENFTILPVSDGGTGSSTPAGARSSIGAKADFSVLPISEGGTGASDVDSARKALGAKADFSVLPISEGGTGASSTPEIQSNAGLFSDIAIIAEDKETWKSLARSAILARVRGAGGISAGNCGWTGHDFCYFIAWRIYKYNEYDRCSAIIYGTGDLTDNKVQFWDYDGATWNERVFNT